MTNKKMWAIIVALVVVVAIIAVVTGVFSKPPADDEGTPPDAPTEVVREEKEDEPDVEGTGVEDDVNMGSITGSGQGNEDMSKLPKEEQDRIKAQHEAEQAKAQEQTQETNSSRRNAACYSSRARTYHSQYPQRPFRYRRHGDDQQ